MVAGTYDINLSNTGLPQQPLTLLAEKLTGRLTSNTRPSSSQDPQQHFLVKRPRTSYVQDKHEEPPELGATRPKKHGGLPTVRSTLLRQKMAFWKAKPIKCTLSLLVYWTFAVLPQLVLTAQDLYASYVAFSGLRAFSLFLSLSFFLSPSPTLSLALWLALSLSPFSTRWPSESHVTIDKPVCNRNIFAVASDVLKFVYSVSVFLTLHLVLKFKMEKRSESIDR